MIKTSWAFYVTLEIENFKQMKTEKDYPKGVHRATKVFLSHMSQVANKQIYSFEKVNNGHMRAFKSSYMAEYLIKMIVGRFQQHSSKDIKIKLCIDQGRYAIQVDPLEFEMVLQSLLARAIEISQQKGVILISSLYSDEKYTLTIEVSESPESVKQISRLLSHIDSKSDDLFAERLVTGNEADSKMNSGMDQDEEIFIEEQPEGGVKFLYSMPASEMDPDDQKQKSFLQMTLDSTSERKVEIPPEWDRIDFQDNKVVSKIYHFISENCHNPDLNVDHLATECNKSRRNLYRFIKKELDMTPAEMIREIKMEKAFEILKNDSDLTIDEVAYKVGYQKPLWFKKLFVERFGIDPEKVK